MVVGAFPIAKLVYLGVKRLSKPVANVIKDAARRSDFFKTHVCMPPAQAYRWVETRFTFGQDEEAKTSPPDQEAKTDPPREEVVELGAELLGETVIFLVGGACLVLEYNRQAANSRCKEEELNGTLAGLQARIGELAATTETLAARLTEVDGTLQSKSPPPKM